MSKLLSAAALWIGIGTSLWAQQSAPRPTAPRDGTQNRTEQFADGYLRRYDSNSDGMLQREEWTTSTLFSGETDRDGNGVITKDEIVLRIASGTRISVASEPRQRSNSRDSSPSEPPAKAASEQALRAIDPIAQHVDLPPVEGPAERLLIFVRHAPAGNLAELLNKHFESGEAPRVRVIADLVSNSLLITASPELLKQVTALIEQLDRTPATVQLEIVVVQQSEIEPSATAAAPSRPSAGKSAEEDLQTGPAEDVLAKIERWETQGKLAVLHRLKLSTLEMQQAMVQIGHRKPVVQGVTVSTRGESRNVMDHNVGVLLTATPRVTGEAVLVELNFEKSDIQMHPHDPPLNVTAAGEKIPSTRTVTSTAKSTVTIPRGQAVVLADVRTSSPGEQNRLLLVVTAGASGSAGKNGD